MNNARRHTPIVFLLSLCLGSAGCNSDPVITFGPRGSLVTAAGKGGFRFGTASSATQIEDQNPNTDWYHWTQAKPAGLGHDTFLGDAARGYTLALADVERAADLGLDALRFSVEWARLEPTPGQYDETAFAHYGALIDALLARGIRPMITLHHFTWPRWVSDPSKTDCAAQGPQDDNLCGLETEAGYLRLAAAMSKVVAEMARRWGDRVDEWYTLNEPVNYVLAAYGAGQFPPARMYIFDFAKLMPIFRRYFDLHARLAKSLRDNDTLDADGDGRATAIGLGLSLHSWVPARKGRRSEHPDDIAARDLVNYIMREAPIRFLTEGGFDPDLDGVLDEPQPSWRNTLDWIGVQTYFRSGVTADRALIPELGLTFCFAEGSDFGLGACIPAEDPSYNVPAMGYAWGPGILEENLLALAARFPDIPLVVTENGIAAQESRRRSEVMVRSLEEIANAQRAGVDVRGYYHWTLVDNFEWNLGYTPRFGLYRVERSDFSRTPTHAVETYQKITRARGLPSTLRHDLGGAGPLTPPAASP
ncbi:MAG: glycoside hydrolase family 1 protein [Deltaproteobacteria bacterium]|nr:glycoside hydrolase family 1 protein [Deltaproteobacteria bacterium]